MSLSAWMMRRLAGKRMTLALMLDGQDTGVHEVGSWELAGDEARIDATFTMPRYMGWNGVGFFDGTDLIFEDRLGAEPRHLFPGDEWVYKFNYTASEHRG